MARYVRVDHVFFLVEQPVSSRMVATDVNMILIVVFNLPRVEIFINYQTQFFSCNIEKITYSIETLKLRFYCILTYKNS